MTDHAPIEPEFEPSQEGELAGLEGELTAAPRGPWLTVLLAVSGLLLVIEASRALGRLVLALRRPARIRLTETTIEVRGSTTLLGRVLREHLTIVPRNALMHATREVRYPRLGLYAGLVALTIGSYLGVGLTVDGVRAGSPSLFGTGLLIVLMGLLLDFAFSSVLPGARGRTRLLLMPRRGPAVCLANVAPSEADRFLHELAGHPASSTTLAHDTAATDATAAADATDATDATALPALAASGDVAGGSGADAVASEAEREAAEQPR